MRQLDPKTRLHDLLILCSPYYYPNMCALFRHTRPAPSRAISLVLVQHPRCVVRCPQENHGQVRETRLIRCSIFARYQRWPMVPQLRPLLREVRAPPDIRARKEIKKKKFIKKIQGRNEIRLSFHVFIPDYSKCHGFKSRPCRKSRRNEQLIFCLPSQAINELMPYRSHGLGVGGGKKCKKRSAHKDRVKHEDP